MSQNGFVTLTDFTCQGPQLLIVRFGQNRCRMHGGKAPGAPKGNRHAFRHGRYTAEAIAERRGLTALLRDMKG